METPFLPATVGAECRRDLALLLATFFLLAWPTTSSDARWSPPSPPLSRSAFPPGFIFGTASSAYQYEGAASEGGRGPSNWDTLTHTRPEYIADRSNGDQAVDFYHRYEEDVHMMQDMGWDAFRFSISWSRILPNGKLTGGINKEGIRFYNNLINSLISKGLKPFVTLLHFDVPQALEDKYRGFISNEIVDDFKAYSDICFREFGDRVKHWITMNEPGIFVLGYATTSSTPDQCSQWKRSNCTEADSGLEPYIVAHNQLLAHAAAAKLYKDRYQASQKGLIGITLASNWYLPYSNSKSDKQARSRALDFMYGWFMDPLTKGEYPASMRTFVGHRLPRFTNRESRVVKGSFDFIGINYYTANYVRDNPSKNNATANYFTDAHTKQSGERNGKLIGRQAASSWLYVYPHGFEELLHYTKQKYNNPVIYITENGIDEVNDERLNLTTALEDDSRIDYHSKHLVYLEKAIREGVDVRGYFAWSFLDNFEWNMGYTVRFGLNYVDYKHGLKRYPKKSALWFQNFLKGGT